MATKPKPLTREEARTMTRSQILDRVEAEQAYFDGKRRKTPADRQQQAEMFRIFRAAINPGLMLDDALAFLKDGIRSSYMDQRPDIPDAPGGDT